MSPTYKGTCHKCGKTFKQFLPYWNHSGASVHCGQVVPMEIDLEEAGE